MCNLSFYALKSLEKLSRLISALEHFHRLVIALNPMKNTQNPALQWLSQPILPVVVVENAAEGLWVAEGLTKGGIHQIEITLRTAGALDAISSIAREFPQMRLSAGTIRSADDFKRAHEAGATLFISPGFTSALAQAAHDQKLVWVPGVATASEVMMAHEAGFNVLKFFPAMAAGGPSALSGIASALGGIRFIPTGGVKIDTLSQWKAIPCVAGVGGTWLTTGLSKDAVGATELAKRSTEALAAW
jgi:2-dehydro-3-deoxyphosphogluconate aldolase / (4S)-4-hydroxy-2-oxoglutarate aldolase